MITFDSLTLKALQNEETGFITGARVNKIQQPTRRELLLTLRNKGISRQLYVNIDPQSYHVCFPSAENLAKRHLQIPQKPPMFCMLLRKYLNNAVISKVNKPTHERILELYFDTYNELGEKTYICLAIEFMGKYSNIILYNYDTNIILGCAHNVGSEKSRARELFGTIPYVYPPKQIKKDILEYNGEINYSTLQNDFYEFSKAFSIQCDGQPLEKLKDFVLLNGLSPAISADFSQYCLFGNLLKNSNSYKSVNDMIDNYFAYHIEVAKIKSVKNNYLSVVSQRIKKMDKTINQMKIQFDKNNNADKYRLYGDLIMANLYNLRDFSEVISVYDYENNKQIEIELDKTKTLKENANKFYKLYNKSKTSNEKLLQLYEAAKQNLSYNKDLEYSINSAKDLEELFELEDEINPEAAKPLNKKTAIEPQKIDLSNETRIYIGKNNKQNNYIVTKLANDEDLWFHVKDTPGSHVLLKTQNVTDELILQCAKLAKEFSTAANSAKAGVIYTKKKYLKRPPQTPLGYVTYKNEQEIVV